METKAPSGPGRDFADPLHHTTRVLSRASRPKALRTLGGGDEGDQDEDDDVKWDDDDDHQRRRRRLRRGGGGGRRPPSRFRPRPRRPRHPPCVRRAFGRGPSSTRVVWQQKRDLGPKADLAEN